MKDLPYAILSWSEYFYFIDVCTNATVNLSGVKALLIRQFYHDRKA